ncbi:MAG: hypothetical protein IK088_05015 [Lachnospiraceae bacterium]|nr:hypothetical protein [Lachnospiraceae bacterium]MBR4768322.1 hypothetical protein [Lachnospiraceae bacterium]
MDKRNWKLIYSNYEGMEKKAVELVSEEMGAYILRDNGIYTIHVLPCEQEKNAVIDRNAVVIGLVSESAIIRKIIPEDEVPEDGFAVKVIQNPELPEFKLALITAKTPEALFYGATDFVDDYFVKAAPEHGAVHLMNEVFDFEMPDYCHVSRPAVKKRTVFAWGHTINDYRDYLRNMARLRLNQLIIWNDYAPINAKDVVQYAHEYGIEVLWGFAWGWSTNCAEVDFDHLDKLTEDIVRNYEENYGPTGADGIYFQSFTELPRDSIGNKLIAEVVTDFVNQTAGALLEKHPDLYIEFGLHATSVKDHLEYIAKVDPRVAIIWEDCGCFPYAYQPFGCDPGEFEEAVSFTDSILKLRDGKNAGMLFKGFLTMDWVGRFAHQAGQFILGNAGERLVKHDREMLRQSWRFLQSGWMKNGELTYRMAKHIHETGPSDVTLGLVGQFGGAIWFPEALGAAILWECDTPYDELFEKVAKRRVIELA